MGRRGSAEQDAPRRTRPRHGDAAPAGDTTMNSEGFEEYRVARGGGARPGGCAHLMTCGQQSGGPSRTESAAKHGLEGTWFVQVTLRNCATNAPIGPPFNSWSPSIAAAPERDDQQPGLRGRPAQSGSRQLEFQGHHTYSQRMISLINFDTAANLPGTPGFNPSSAGDARLLRWLVDRHPHLGAHRRRPRRLAGTNEFFRPMARLYRTGCSTAVAQRFE